jgi:hypothetical protein
MDAGGCFRGAFAGGDGGFGIANRGDWSSRHLPGCFLAWDACGLVDFAACAESVFVTDFLQRCDAVRRVIRVFIQLLAVIGPQGVVGI